MGRIEDLGLVADKGLEWKAKCGALTAERDQLRAENERLRADTGLGWNHRHAELLDATARAEAAEQQLEFDRTTCHNFINALDAALDGRFWLTEGRGSYSWDDDRYRAEFHDAAEVQHGDAVGEIPNHPEIVRDEQIAGAAIAL